MRNHCTAPELKQAEVPQVTAASIVGPLDDGLLLSS